MKINSIELVGFKRLALNNIHHFQMDLVERVQLILGTNGSGKSSLVGELTPLPAVRANYTKGGRKVISITKGNHEYVLRNDFGADKEHSFLKDGEELNPGGTVTVQKDLVWQEFGIRQEIHELMTGVEKFTSMSPSRRREWFTQLCDTNYDYALGVYNKYRERHRDTTGALKLAKKRLVVETAKIVTAEEVEKIGREIDDLVREIELLYRSRSDNLPPAQTLQQQLDHYHHEMSRWSERYFSIRGWFGRRHIFTEAELRESIDLARHELTRTSTQVELLHKEHAELKQSHEAFIQSGAHGRKANEELIESLKVKKEDAQKLVRLGLTFPDQTEAYLVYHAIKDSVQEILSQLPENRERLYSHANLVQARQELLTVKNQLLAAERRLEGLRHQKQHLDQIKNGEDTQCPQCNHRWHPGFSQLIYDELVSSLEKGAVFLTQTQAKQTALEKVIADNTAYGDLLRELMRVINGMPALSPFWDYLANQDLVITAPRSALTKFTLLGHDLEQLSLMAHYDKEMAKAQDLINTAIRMSNVDIDKITTRLETVENQLGLLAQETRLKNQFLQTQQQDLNHVIEIGQIEKKLKDFQQASQASVLELVKATRNDFINACLKQLQIELAQKQNTLNDINMQKGIIRDIQATIDRLSHEEECLKLLVSSLSPTDGLIAEGLLGFIREFVRQMNVVIASVWTYRMEVQDCGMDGEGNTELDYKFGLLIQNEDNVAPDIGKGSTGQREIVDLAFRIVAMNYLKISENQLVLDEFASNMDPGHREASVELIKQLLYQLPFSQMFVVSHDYQQYGALTQAQICVLCARNVVAPAEYNQHVKMQ